MSCRRFVEAQPAHYPTQLACHILGAPASGYYAWQQTQQQALATGPPAQETMLVMMIVRHKRRYGPRPSRSPYALRDTGSAFTAYARPCVDWGCTRGNQGHHPAHDRLHPQIMLRAEPSARPVQTNPGQPGVGQRHHELAYGHRRRRLLGMPFSISSASKWSAVMAMMLKERVATALQRAF